MTEILTEYSRVASAREFRPWKNRQPVLGRLDIELTERCNLGCVHCYINQPVGARELARRELSLDQIKQTLSEACELGALTVRFTGGEPLLRPDFPEIYLLARRMGLRVMLFTNATLLTPALADLFARVPPLEKIEVTVYGITPATYTAVTGVAGAYKSARRGIELLIERQVPFIVKGALLPQNTSERQAFEAWAGALPGVDHAPRYSMHFTLRARRDDAEKNARIARLRIAPEDAVRQHLTDSDGYRREMVDFCGRFIGPPGDALFTCGAGLTPSVDAYGRTQMCLMLRHPETVCAPAQPGGNPVLREAVTQFFPAVRELRAQNPDYLERCARCFLKGLCEQCPAQSWMEHGTLDTPVDYLCQVAHAKARDLGLIGPGENAWEVEAWKERVERLRLSTAGPVRSQPASL